MPEINPQFAGCIMKDHILLIAGPQDLRRGQARNSQGQDHANPADVQAGKYFINRWVEPGEEVHWALSGAGMISKSLPTMAISFLILSRISTIMWYFPGPSWLGEKNLVRTTRDPEKNWIDSP